MNEDWLQRFEQGGLMTRIGLLGGGAVRLAARTIDRTLEKAAQVTVEAQDAFQKELDPNISDAKILEETNDRDAR